MLQATDNQIDRLTRFQSGLLNAADDTSLESNNSPPIMPKLSKNLMAAINVAVPQVNTTVMPKQNSLDDRPVEDLINEAEKDLPESTKMNIG